MSGGRTLSNVSCARPTDCDTIIYFCRGVPLSLALFPGAQPQDSGRWPPNWVDTTPGRDYGRFKVTPPITYTYSLSNPSSLFLPFLCLPLTLSLSLPRYVSFPPYPFLHLTYLSIYSTTISVEYTVCKEWNTERSAKTKYCIISYLMLRELYVLVLLLWDFIVFVFALKHQNVHFVLSKRINFQNVLGKLCECFWK